LKCLHHAHCHRLSILALSIVWFICGIAVPAKAECAFVASNSRRRPSFVQTSPSSPRALPRAMATNNNVEDEAELPASGSFFNEVPPPKEESSDGKDGAIENSMESAATPAFPGDDMFAQIVRTTKLDRSPGGKGFSKTMVAPSIIQTPRETFVGIGKPLNDVRNPEYDENGYTLYADEATGEKKRVFEALVEYPSVFKMKIVGQDDERESFAPEMAALVAKSCGVETSMVKHTQRKNGKWTSVTVHAPVRDADMLYALYENVDKDPRVKFKF